MEEQIKALNFKNKHSFTITWPLLIELSLHMGMGIVATLMLSHYSDQAVAGVGVANQLLNIFILVFNVTSIGATVLISQNLGAGKLKHARQLSYSVFGLNFWFGISIAIIVFVLGEPMLRLYNIHGRCLTMDLPLCKSVHYTLFRVTAHSL